MSLAAVLDAATDDTLLAIAIALPTPTDLLRLALTCRAAAQRFYFTTTNYSSGGTAAAAATAGAPDLWSLVEEAACRWIADCTDQEQGWVPRRGRESWLGLMWEVESLRRGAVFGRSHRTITLSAGGSVATRRSAFDATTRGAASRLAMRAGRHYVQSTALSGKSMHFGVICPGWRVEGGKDAQYVDGHCFYFTFSGHRYPGRNDWKGMQSTREVGDRIGMLLDLDQGTMTVYKNDERLGVMATGLSGEYSWAVTIVFKRDSVRIEAAEAPASPTADELARARA